MEKYYWDVLVKVLELYPVVAEEVLDKFTDKLDYNINTMEEAIDNVKAIKDLEFMFDEQLDSYDKYYLLGDILASIKD